MVPKFEPMLAAFKAANLTSGYDDRVELEQACLVAARRGWTEAGPGNSWVEDASTLVQQYFRDELTPEVLQSHENGAASWAMFASFAVGWLLALQNAGSLDERESFTAFATLPGFMWQHEERVTGGVV